MSEQNLAVQFLEAAGVTIATAVASVLGGIGGLALADRPTWRQALLIVCAGTGTGAYGGEIVKAWWGLEGVAASSVAFFLAICGMPILGFLFGLVNRLRRRADAAGDRVLDRVLPPPPPPPAPGAPAAPPEPPAKPGP